MAQQLATLRSPAAYAGVTAYAHAHSGEAASAAWLALGHAYLLDHKYADAVSEFKNAEREGTALDDYAAYLTAQSYLQSNKLPSAQPILATFIQKYPDSVFIPQIPVLEANLYIQEGDPQNALRVLNAHKSEPIANKADFQLALAKASLMSGDTALAQRLYTHLYLDYPLSSEAAQARAQLVTSGAIDSMPVSERRRCADALYAAHRYSEAEEEYRSLAASPSLTDGAHNAMLVAAAACQWKLHTLGREELDRLPDTSDEAGARRLYLLMELARDKDDTGTQQSIVTQMESRFPTSPWLAEALYSSGNMYLLRKDYPTAIRYYVDLSTRFPKSCESPHSGPCSNYSPSAHWRAAWLTYRLGNYTQAAQMIDDQISRYAGGEEIPAALYWRARLYSDQEHNPAMAVKYYRTVARVYSHYYYADLAGQRLAQMGFSVSDVPTGSAELDALQPEEVPELSDDVPDQDPHLVKARLLANAGLNEYISPEIQAADGSDEWGGFAEAQIYASYGEPWRAMRLMKRAVPFYTSAPIDALPLAYWRILFPEPYWSTIRQDAAQNGLDPYMVASLIRQESEFNPNAVSYANAWGLMQLLPRVGKELAKQEGIHHFETRDLLDPTINIRLGCLYLRQSLDKFGGRPEYAFAAYNAGDNRVLDWQAAGQFHEMDEFVESIPFTQTRNYVQAILRNENIYRDLDKAESQRAASRAPAVSSSQNSKD
jgi:soluble lytic murein transglycosylase